MCRSRPISASRCGSRSPPATRPARACPPARPKQRCGRGRRRRRSGVTDSFTRADALDAWGRAGRPRTGSAPPAACSRSAPTRPPTRPARAAAATSTGRPTTRPTRSAPSPPPRSRPKAARSTSAPGSKTAAPARPSSTKAPGSATQPAPTPSTSSAASSNGSWTTIATINGPDLAVGDQLAFKLAGTSLSLHRKPAGSSNWTQILAATDTTITGPGRLGLELYNAAGAKADDWTISPDLPTGSGGGSVPLNTALPTVSGTAQVGQTLSGTVGSWSGASSFAQQWQRCSGASCNPITQRDRPDLSAGHRRSRLHAAAPGHRQQHRRPQPTRQLGPNSRRGRGRRRRLGGDGFVHAGRRAHPRDGLVDHDPGRRLQLPARDQRQPGRLPGRQERRLRPVLDGRQPRPTRSAPSPSPRSPPTVVRSTSRDGSKTAAAARPSSTKAPGSATRPEPTPSTSHAAPATAAGRRSPRSTAPTSQSATNSASNSKAQTSASTANPPAPTTGRKSSPPPTQRSAAPAASDSSSTTPPAPKPTTGQSAPTSPERPDLLASRNKAAPHPAHAVQCVAAPYPRGSQRPSTRPRRSSPSEIARWIFLERAANRKLYGTGAPPALVFGLPGFVLPRP